MEISSRSLRLFNAISISSYGLALCSVCRIFSSEWKTVFLSSGFILIGIIAVLCVLLCISDKRFFSHKGWKELRGHMPEISRKVFYGALFTVIISTMLTN